MNNSEIKDYIKSLNLNLDDSNLAIFCEGSKLLKLPKGTLLISEGKKHYYFYFLVKGTVKSYSTKESKEICLWFAFEDEMIATIRTFNDKPSKETIELLEDSELIQFRTQKIKSLAETNLAISNLLNHLITEHATFLEERIYQLQFMSAKERYHALIEIIPEILQKVSLTDIASFLGISRETLSRVRNQKPDL